MPFSVMVEHFLICLVYVQLLDTLICIMFRLKLVEYMHVLESDCICVGLTFEIWVHLGFGLKIFLEVLLS